MIQFFASSGQIVGSFGFSISTSNECLGLISFRMDWLDLFVVQETLKSLLQHHNSKASMLPCSVFFMVHLLQPYVTTGKTIAFTRQTFVRKGLSLLFNMLSTFVIAFLPKRKRLSISRLQWPFAVILESKKMKYVPAFTFSLLSVRWWDQMPWSLFFNVEF